ncbi:glutathione S-transferase [Roseovarius sp. HI0049]|nr:glutathione S-transferase [Roseovarius sp. HI0049]
MTRPYRLHYAPDNASLIIRLVLEEMGAPYETALIDRKARGHKAPAYLKVNPAGLIPALETPEGPIFETGAILLWLADRHGALAPVPDSAERGAFLKWLFFTSNTLHTAMRMRFYPAQYVGDDAAAQAELREHLKGEIARHLTLIEAQAAERPGWLCAAAPSVLDFYLACLIRWLQLYPAEEDNGWFRLADWPHMQAMATRLERCQAVKAAIDAEGLGETPFTAPRHPTPPEGSAT